MSEKAHIRIALPDGSFSEAGKAVGPQTLITQIVHELGAGVSEYCEGETKDMIRIRTDIDRRI